MSQDCPRFEVTKRSKVRRLPKRAVYDKRTAHAILDAAFLCHVAFVRPDNVGTDLDAKEVEGSACPIDQGAESGGPVCIPQGFVRDGDSILLHGKSSSLLQRRLEAGDPVCVTVSIVDGLVMARSAFNHSMNYRSVVIFGRATLISDPEEKLRALRLMTDGLTYPGRWSEMRAPTDVEIMATSVNRLPLVEVACKVRGEGPGDDKADMNEPCWAGVIPFQMVSLPPVIDTPQLAPATIAPLSYDSVTLLSNFGPVREARQAQALAQSQLRIWKGLCGVCLAMLVALFFR